MEFKLPPLDVPTDAPFKNDALKRKPSVEALANLVDNLRGPFILGLDSPWGTGKTTFIRMWMAHMEQGGHRCLYFNAWETDFTADPLVALLGELDALGSEIKSAGFAKQIRKAKKIATSLAKKAIPIAIKIATAGVLDLSPEVEKELAQLASDSAKDAVETYLAEKNLVIKFREALAKSVAALKQEGKKDNLVIFVDELDRCRPTFALELLERMKHLFNVENVIFVLAIDKSQLSVSLQALYGSGLNTEEYLRRFLDLEFTLPPPATASFTDSLFARFGFAEFFKARTHPELRSDQSNLIDTFNSLSDIFRLSLRTREQCFTRLRVAMLSTPENHYLYPFLMAALLILRAAAPSVYRNYALEDASHGLVVDQIRKQPDGKEFLEKHAGAVLEAYLISATTNRPSQEEAIKSLNKAAADEKTPPKERERADTIAKILHHISVRDLSPNLKHVVNKIELAAQFVA